MEKPKPMTLKERNDLLIAYINHEISFCELDDGLRQWNAQIKQEEEKTSRNENKA